MAERHEREAKRGKRMRVIGAAVAATVAIGGITAAAVGLSGSAKQTKDRAATVADGVNGGTSSPLGSDPSAAPSSASPSGSASASASPSGSTAPSGAASARPSAGKSTLAAPGQVSAAPGAPASQLAPPPGTPGVPDSARGEIKNVHSGMALEIENSRTDDGAAADQWTYNPKNPTMNWYLHWVGDSWEIRNVNSNMCLQIPDGPNGQVPGNGVHADQWTCNGAAGQHWDLKPGMGGGQQVVNHRSGECLEVENSQTSNGAVVQQWQCYAMGDHSWVLP